MILLMLSVTFGCTRNPPQFKAFTCEEPGTIGNDRVVHPTQNFDISFRYYLPPCYEKQTDARFPVIYLITMPIERQLNTSDTTPMSLTDRLIRAEKMPPVIIVVPNDLVAQGYHFALAKDLVPYVDEKFQTIKNKRYRGVGGISHGAGIAARMAFQFPELFGSLGVFSGGIDSGEKSTFEAWIDSIAPEDYPRILINIGEQDGMMPYTQNLLGILDSQNVPYEINIEPGGHNWEFWSTRMESYLFWFVESWK
jgi:enterochelin esterase-like enzyme